MNNILPINKVICGDAIEQLKLFPDNFFDSIVTDPPAGISFMNKKWDSDKGGRDSWIKWLTEVMTEAKRVLKPGGHALVWALPRTSHWTGFALENAGFEVRDIVHHLFGSGFPKSMDISKAIDKQAGAKREVVMTIKKKPSASADCNEGWVRPWAEGKTTMDITAAATPEAKQWSGWGTALKPAVECWWLVRKPCSEKTVAQNVLKWGTGALNIDGCRVSLQKDEQKIIATSSTGFNEHNTYHKGTGRQYTKVGRFPANLIHDGSDEVIALFPQSKGQQGDVKGTEKSHTGDQNTNCYGAYNRVPQTKRDDCGSAARFFYCAKPSKAERDAGLNGMKEKACGMMEDDNYPILTGSGNPRQTSRKNHHPTVKAQALMEYLIKLITPPNGIVLDMFAGSGSTLIAAKKLGYSYIGIEIDPDYCEIAELRLIADLNGNRSLDAYNDIASV